MRILIAVELYYPQVNGGVYFTKRLAEGLAARGHQVALIAPAAEARWTNVQQNGITIHGMPSFPLPTFMSETTRICLRYGNKSHIRRIVDEFEPEIVHLQHHFMLCKTVLSVVRERDCPVMLTNHSMPDNLLPVMPVPGFAEPLVAELLWRDISAVASKVDFVTTPTESAAELIRPRLAKPVVAVSNGIDPVRFSPGPRNERVRAHYDLPAGPFFLFVGRLDLEKNIAEIVRAFSRLGAETGWSLVIAGVGTQRKLLGKLAKDLGVADKVYFPGFIEDEDLPDLYRLASCFVIACTCELQSLVSLEALSTGLPILGVNAVALPELVHDGVNGFLFGVGETEVLAERMRLISRNESLRARMGQENLAIAARHDIGTTLETYEQFYAMLSESDLQASSEPARMDLVDLTA